MLCAMLAFAPQCAMLFLDPSEEQLALLVELTARYTVIQVSFYFPLALVNIVRFSIQGKMCIRDSLQPGLTIEELELLLS